VHRGTRQNFCVKILGKTLIIVPYQQLRKPGLKSQNDVFYVEKDMLCSETYLVMINEELLGANPLKTDVD